MKGGCDFVESISGKSTEEQLYLLTGFILAYGTDREKQEYINIVMSILREG